MGATPPMTCPVCSRTNSGFARTSLSTPRRADTAPGSTRCAPEGRISTGAPSASKSRLLAMAPTSQPRASAARAAVWTVSGSTTTRPVPPRRWCSSRNRVMAGCSVVMWEDPRVSSPSAGGSAGRAVADERCGRAFGDTVGRQGRGVAMNQQRPGSVTGAIWLLAGVIAMAGVTALLTAVFEDDLLDSWAAGRSDVGSVQPPAVVPVAITMFVVVALLAAVLIVFFSRGLNWARLLLTALVVFMGIAALAGLRTDPPALFVAVLWVWLAVDVGALVALWRSDTRGFTAG